MRLQAPLLKEIVPPSQRRAVADLIHADTKGNSTRSQEGIPNVSSLKRKPNSWDALLNWLPCSRTLQPAPGTFPGESPFSNAGTVAALGSRCRAVQLASGILPGASNERSSFKSK